jgi:hypothetical protein
MSITHPERFFKAFEHCLNNKFFVSQAKIAADKYSAMGMPDASAGCMHYVLRLKELYLRNRKDYGNDFKF